MRAVKKDIVNLLKRFFGREYPVPAPTRALPVMPFVAVATVTGCPHRVSVAVGRGALGPVLEFRDFAGDVVDRLVCSRLTVRRLLAEVQRMRQSRDYHETRPDEFRGAAGGHLSLTYFGAEEGTWQPGAPFCCEIQSAAYNRRRTDGWPGDPEPGLSISVDGMPRVLLHDVPGGPLEAFVEALQHAIA